MAQLGVHTVKAFDEDLEQLRALVAEIGGRAEAALANAMQALAMQDEALAAEVVDGDRKIDALASEIERQSVRLIALRAPMADDLREILAALKTSIVIERIGDNAKKIARRALPARSGRDPEAVALFPTMAECVAAMIRSALDAFIARDADAARRTALADEEVDQLYHTIFRQLVAEMIESPSTIGRATDFMIIAQSLERIADHAVDIADAVCFAATGDRLAAEAQAHAQAVPA
ncbi:phosphate signaling complex protein PhoU [Sphingosinicella humi]|uniref:phosphate signaling complex protein PhoU n=1 Tax=Allosphingosinicella humi TaxID=2068657 RepID=UPI001FB0E3E3|nr:phosphate signaling complex protein PhoU [Sphingosinicella humi]